MYSREHKLYLRKKKIRKILVIFTQIISKEKENKKDISYIYSNFISGTFNFYMGITCYI